MPALLRRQGALTGVTSTLADGGMQAGHAAKNAAEGLSSLEIMAVVVAGIACVALAIWCLWWSCRRKAYKREAAKSRDADADAEKERLSHNAAPSPTGGMFERHSHRQQQERGSEEGARSQSHLLTPHYQPPTAYHSQLQPVPAPASYAGQPQARIITAPGYAL